MTQTHTRPGADIAPARSRFNFVVAAYGLLVLLVGANMATPLYPLYEKQFGFGPMTVTLVFAVYAVVLIPSLLVFGPLSDAIGRRAVLLPAICGGLLGSIVMLFAAGTGWLFVARVIQGISLGAIQGTASATLVETEPRGNRGWATTVASATTAGATALGPLLGGAIGEYLPAPLHTSFVVHIGLAVVALLLVLRLPRAAERGGSWRPRKPKMPPQARAPFLTAGAAGFLAWAVTALFLALVPSFLESLRGGAISVGLAGLCVGLMLGVSAVAQFASRSASNLASQLGGLGVLVVGLGTLALASVASRLDLLLVAAVVIGIGQGLAFRGSLAIVNHISPDADRANVVSLYYVIVYIGVAFPVIGVGFLSQAVGLVPAVLSFAVAIAVLAAAGGLATLAVRGHRALAEPLAKS
jgi:MFS family permease